MMRCPYCENYDSDDLGDIIRHVRMAHPTVAIPSLSLLRRKIIQASNE